MPYLMLKDAAGFIRFTEQVFGAELTFKRMRADESTVMHAEIQISGCTIMFSEATDQWKPATANLFIYVEDADKTFAKAIEQGATVVTDLADQDYGRSGGVKDPCENVWWITSVK